jgi:hypothetical protein
VTLRTEDFWLIAAIWGGWLTGTLMMLSALVPKGKCMSYDPQPAPDIAYLRRIGIALLALTIAVGGITVAGCLATSEPMTLAQSVYGNSAATGLALMQPLRNISKTAE